MKTIAILSLSASLLTMEAGAQGVFLFFNGSAPTRIGSLDGAYAGTNIMGQMLVGPSAGSLAPVGFARQHAGNGLIGGVINTTVPSVPAYSYAYVQLWVWDSVVWGLDFYGVPSNQFGRTDIVQVYLTSGEFPDVVFGPQFTQPAIVPVPEPSAIALLALAGGAACFGWRGRKHVRCNAR